MPQQSGIPAERTDFGEAPGWLAPCLIQLTVAVAIPFIWEGYLESAIGWSQFYGLPFGPIGTQVAAAVALAILSFLTGSVVTLLFRGASRTGRWVFVPPAVLLALFMIWEGAAVGWLAVFRDFFFWAHPGRDEGIAMRSFLTYPAWSSAFFSIAAAVVRRARTKPDRQENDGQEQPAIPN